MSRGTGRLCWRLNGRSRVEGESGAVRGRAAGLFCPASRRCGGDGVNLATKTVKRGSGLDGRWLRGGGGGGGERRESPSPCVGLVAWGGDMLLPRRTLVCARSPTGRRFSGRSTRKTDATSRPFLLPLVQVLPPRPKAAAAAPAKAPRPPLGGARRPPLPCQLFFRSSAHELAPQPSPRMVDWLAIHTASGPLALHSGCRSMTPHTTNCESP